MEKEIRLKTEKEIKKEFEEQIEKIRLLLELVPLGVVSEYVNSIVEELTKLNAYPRTRYERLRLKSPERFKRKWNHKNRSPEVKEHYLEYNKLRTRMHKNGTWEKYMDYRANFKLERRKKMKGKSMSLHEVTHEYNKADITVMRDFCEGKREE